MNQSTVIEENETVSTRTSPAPQGGGVLLTVAHEQWNSRPADQRFRSLEELETAVASRREISREHVTNLGSEITFKAEEGKLLVEQEHREDAVMTNWAFGQIANIAEAPARFMRTLTPETAAIVLNERLQRDLVEDGEGGVKIMRLLSDEGPDTIQAVTSPTYGRIWDADVVGMVRRIVDMSDGKFYNPKAYEAGVFGAEPVPSGLYASDRDVFMFLIDGGSMFDEGERAQFNRGFIVSNSEVGKASLTMWTFLFNLVCGNHYIMGAQDIDMKRIIHSSSAPQKFAEQAFDDLQRFTAQDPDLGPVKRAMETMLEGLEAGGFNFAKEQEKWVKAFATSHKFSQAEVREAILNAVREEGKCETLFDLVQGFTASARSIPHADTRLDLERRSGKLLRTNF